MLCRWGFSIKMTRPIKQATKTLTAALKNADVSRPSQPGPGHVSFVLLPSTYFRIPIYIAQCSLPNLGRLTLLWPCLTSVSSFVGASFSLILTTCFMTGPHWVSRNGHKRLALRSHIPPYTGINISCRTCLSKNGTDLSLRFGKQA